MMLNVKSHQNLTLDLDSSQYTEALRLRIECMRFSPLAQALTVAECVPLVHLSKAYFATNYSQTDGVITFEVAPHKTSNSKARFCRCLRFTAKDGVVDPDLISSSALIDMFYQMGYIGNISLFSKFRKTNLPPMWNELFTLFFKSLSGRVFGSDSASILFCTIIYGLYTRVNLDYGDIL
ncbi:unnamed protein product [Lactuca saligna]|uniref:Uncharacterized protein n=1 Tax=Lactuca saligna TaxID=75948 RepID=A0AA36DWD9_LACSI|nr:unnamed protein product [Lactuca saligna]